MPRPMRPAPRQTMRSRMLMATLSLESFAQQLLQPYPVEMAETQALQGSSGGHEILAADRAADGGEATGERRRDTSERGDRDQERQADAGVLQHVAVGGQ